MYYDIHTHKTKYTNDLNILRVYNYLTFETAEVDYSDSPNVYYSAGIHPWYIDPLTYQNQLTILEKQLKVNSKIVALGECGLDKLVDNLSLQEAVFIEQIKLANSYKLPILIHCVKAWEQLIKILKTETIEVPCIIHGYRGNRELTQQLLKHDFYFSLGTKYNVSSIKSIAESKLLLETDNDDSSIIDVYNTVAKDLEISIDKLESIINRNVNIFSF